MTSKHNFHLLDFILLEFFSCFYVISKLNIYLITLNISKSYWLYAIRFYIVTHIKVTMTTTSFLARDICRYSDISYYSYKGDFIEVLLLLAVILAVFFSLIIGVIFIFKARVLPFYCSYLFFQAFFSLF